MVDKNILKQMILQTVTQFNSKLLSNDSNFKSMLGCLQSMLDVCKENGFQAIDLKENRELLNILLSTNLVGVQATPEQVKDMTDICSRMEFNQMNKKVN